MGNRLIVLFGAGASAFSDSVPSSCPPLGKDLLPCLLNHSPFIDRELTETQKDILLSHPAEDAIYKLLPEGTRVICPLQKEIAKYLAQFSPSPGNTYSVFLDELGSELPQVTLATLNYDLMLERSTHLVGKTYFYGPRTCHSSFVPILKPHGSVNFLPEFPGTGGITGVNLVSDSGKYIGGLKLRWPVPDDSREILSWCDDTAPFNDTLAPEMSLYCEGKPTGHSTGTVDRHRDQWAAAVSEATAIVVVGAAVNRLDKHIWGTMAKSRAPIWCVDPTPGEFRRWLKGRGGHRGGGHLADYFDTAIPKIIDLLH